MSKRGHEINLASGVMFSKTQEHARLKKARATMAREMVIFLGKTKGLTVQYNKRPSLVMEFLFMNDAGEQVARRSLVQEDVDREGGRTAAGRLIESVCRDLNLPFDWNDVPDQPEPIERARVDNVGAPPENRERIPPDPSPPPRPREEAVVPDPDPAPANPELGFSPEWTIRQLKDWATDNGTPVPSTVTRKGDIIEWLINEHSDRSG